VDVWKRPRARALPVATIVVLSACLGVIRFDHSATWRAKVIFQKTMGRLPDIGWLDLFSMLRPGSDVYLGPLAEWPNLHAVIVNPRSSESDIEAGARLFRKHCSSCHGDEGRGGTGGPSLRNRTFQHGATDWALYRTITNGIAGTAMVSRYLPRDDTWRLVSYLRHIRVELDAAAATGHEPLPGRSPIAPVTAAELHDADHRPDEWLSYSGSYTSHRHSRLHQINRGNVGQLRVAWLRQFPAADLRLETSPIIRGSTMFVTEPGSVLALDAALGRVLWTYSRDLQPRPLLCCGPQNRGVAVFGDRIFVGTLDGHLVALDANTGKVKWDVTVADASSGYSITAAPLAVDGMVVTGVAGGEFGIRGFIDAYDAMSGQRRWRFYTVPAPGEPGSETWRGDFWRTGGAPTWLTGSFDPDLGLIYWGVGNPSHKFYGADRPGDQLYSNSVVALEASTGKLRWYFQFTPDDTNDWDAVQIPVLVDATIDQSPRKLLAWANRNAFFYLLDRVTGQFLHGTPFARQTWADGLDAYGRPRVRPGSRPSREGSEVYPNTLGATNWFSPSYDPTSQLLYVPMIDRGGILFTSADPTLDRRAKGPVGLTMFSMMADDEETTVAVKALDVTTGQVRWQYKHSPRSPIGTMGGLLSTAGSVVFGGDDEVFFALAAETGAELWRFNAGGCICAAPVTYTVEGRQYVAIAAGRSILAFALPPQPVD